MAAEKLTGEMVARAMQLAAPFSDSSRAILNGWRAGVGAGAVRCATRCVSSYLPILC